MTSRKEEEKRLRNMYSKLNKTNRCIQYSKSSGIPNSYKDNTLKEELVLEHLIQYRKEFAAAVDAKRKLFLYPKNETGKYKFICTTIRPTKVPYPELYEYDKCAKFISDFIEYEELSPPNEFPEYLPAPDNTLLWQIGDCFDISIVLCSLLIGVGYNAYVVYGTAPRFITTKDESNLDCIDLVDDIKIIEPDLNEINEENAAQIVEYTKKAFSQFEIDDKVEKEEKEKNNWIKENVIDDDQPELERFDPWNHKRLHCWVLIKKNKRLNENVYVEPATGRIYPVDNPPFETVDAIFNHINFWINLQPQKPAKEITLNFSDKGFWEYVMLTSQESDDLEDIENEKTNDVIIEKGVVDMPPAWPNKLYISPYSYHNRVPLSTQTFYFSKTKIDKFAPYSQIDGKTAVIYKYLDYSRLRLNEVEIRYRNRADKLYKRIKYPYEHRIVDYYLPGQEFGWKVVDEVEALHKTVYFYETNYDTGLIYRHEIFGKKIIHKYKSRDDKVYERKVEVEAKTKDITSKQFDLDSLYYNKLFLKKFTQKYTVNPLIPVS